VEIIQLPVLRFFLFGEYSAPDLSQFPQPRSAGLGSSLYSLGADPAENVISIIHYIFVDAGLPIHCLETGCITSGIFLRACRGAYLATAAVYRVTA
jgi:hypothetical protein